MADFIDSQTAVLIAVGVVILVWILGFQGRKKPAKTPWDYRF